MFNENKYTKLYYNIISNRQDNPITDGSYTEKHHIIPRSMGGGEGDNLVPLTAREHFLCHYLLTKMTEGDPYYKMMCAFTLMNGNSANMDRYVNSKLYEASKVRLSIALSGDNNHNYGKVRSTDIRTGKVSMVFENEIDNINIFKGHVLLGYDYNTMVVWYNEYLNCDLSLANFSKRINISASSLQRSWSSLFGKDYSNKPNNIEELYNEFEVSGLKLTIFYNKLVEEGRYSKSYKMLFQHFNNIKKR